MKSFRSLATSLISLSTSRMRVPISGSLTRPPIVTQIWPRAPNPGASWIFPDATPSTRAAGPRQPLRRSRWPRSSSVGKVPVQLPGPAVERARPQRAVVDVGTRRDLGEIAARETLVGAEEISIAQGGLNDGDAIAAQQIDHPLPRDAVEERAVRHRRIDHTILRHEHVCISELDDIAEQVDQQPVVEARRLRFHQRTPIVWIEAGRLG